MQERISEDILDFLVELKTIYLNIKAGFNYEDEIEKLDIKKLDKILEENGVDLLDHIEEVIDLSFISKLKNVDSDEIATHIYAVFGLELTEEQSQKLFKKYCYNKNTTI